MKYNLKDVFEIIDQGDRSRIYWSVDKRSTKAVMNLFKSIGKEMTVSESREFILGGILYTIQYAVILSNAGHPKLF